MPKEGETMMRNAAPVLALIAAGFLSYPASASDPPKEPSIGDLSRAGEAPVKPREIPESLAANVLKALKDADGNYMTGGGGGSMGTDHQYWSRRLDSPASPGDIIVSYSQQLAEAGWAPGISHNDGPIALGTWRFSDASGQQWYALLVVETSFEHPANQRNISLRLTRLPLDSK